MDQLRRFVTWLLGGLAIGVATRALVGRRPSDRATAGNGQSPAVDARDELVAATPIAPLAEALPEADQPASHWLTTTAIVRVLAARLKMHTTTVIAGSLAYYALLTMVPAAIAGISIYGLVAEPDDLTSLIKSLADRMPEATAQLIETELGTIISSSGTGLGIVTVVGILAALWSASAGTKVLITGVNLAYGERETRSYLVVRGLALLLTIGMIVGVVVVVAGVAVLPALVESSLTDIVRWPALIVLVVGGLGALYRIAPSDALGRNHPVWPGALSAAAVWLGATAGFSAGVSTFKFGATYGALAGVIVLLLWFFLSGLIVLLGAELNAVIETRKRRLATSWRG